MKNIEDNSINFKRNAKTTKDNSHLIDNLSSKEAYVNPNVQFAQESKFGLHLFKNYLVNDCIEELVYSSKIVYYYDEETKNRYRLKPEIVSYDNYQTTSYWYIILAVNGYRSIFEFKNFTNLMIPSLDKIEEIVKRYEKSGKLESISAI